MTIRPVLGTTLLVASCLFLFGCAARYQVISHCGDLYLLDTRTGELRKAEFTERSVDKETDAVTVSGFRSWQVVSGPDPMSEGEPSKDGDSGSYLTSTTPC